MAESRSNGPRDLLTRFLPHNIQEARPSIKPALLPSQSCVALNFPATGCRLDSSVITVKPDELSMAQGPVRRQDPLGKKAAHLMKPVLPFSRAGPMLPGWVSGPTCCSKPLSTLFILKKERWRSPALLQPNSSAHPYCFILPLPGFARSPLIPNFSGITTTLALLFAAGAQKATDKSHFIAGSSSSAGNYSCMGWEGHTTILVMDNVSCCKSLSQEVLGSITLLTPLCGSGTLWLSQC